MLSLNLLNFVDSGIKPSNFYKYHCLFFQVLRISSLTKEGVPDLWENMLKFNTTVLEAGEFWQKRQKQHKIWMWNYVKDHIMDLFTKHSGVREIITNIEGTVERGEVTPGQGADLLLREFVKEM